MCSREFERLRRKQEAEANRKIALVCQKSVICNGDKDCLKCPYLRELRIVDLDEEEYVRIELEEGCNCS
jgi:hypothetical protein